MKVRCIVDRNVPHLPVPKGILFNTYKKKEGMKTAPLYTISSYVFCELCLCRRRIIVVAIIQLIVD